MIQLFWKTVWPFLQSLYTVTILSRNQGSECLSNLFENTCPHKNLYVIIYSIFIDNFQKLQNLLQLCADREISISTQWNTI